jgi:L-ascorbate metabolism protein UlaG (beta-lactamase superfamily)
MPFPLNGVRITWLGHSTFRIDTPEGKVVLLDPWVVNNPKCPPEHHRFDKIDLMLCTHGHGDHIGDAVALAKAHDPVVVGVYELCLWMQKQGAKQIAPMNKGGSQTQAGVRITMVQAFHSGGIEGGTDIVYGGEPCGYVLEFENGLKVYHAGDTNVFGDMRIIHELYAPDIAMLPIGDLFTMGPREAAYACRLLRPKAVIPIHWGTFPILTGTPKQLRQELQGMGVEVWELEPGAAIS